MGIKRRSSVSPSPARPAPAPARAAAPAPARPAPVQQPAQQHHTAPAQHQPGAMQQPHGQQQPMMQQPHHQPMMHQQQQPMMQHAPPAQGGGLMSNIAGGIMNGMTFGVGSAVANRAVDAIMGPRTVQHEYVNAPPAAAPAAAPAPDQQPVLAHCGGYSSNYQNCLATNSTNPAACGDFMSALQQCQSGRQ